MRLLSIALSASLLAAAVVLPQTRVMAVAAVVAAEAGAAALEGPVNARMTEVEAEEGLEPPRAQPVARSEAPAVAAEPVAG